MKIVILDGHAVNPGDLSWDWLNAFGEKHNIKFTITISDDIESADEVIKSFF